MWRIYAYRFSAAWRQVLISAALPLVAALLPWVPLGPLALVSLGLSVVLLCVFPAARSEALVLALFWTLLAPAVFLVPDLFGLWAAQLDPRGETPVITAVTIGFFTALAAPFVLLAGVLLLAGLAAGWFKLTSKIVFENHAVRIRVPLDVSAEDARAALFVGPINAEGWAEETMTNRRIDPKTWNEAAQDTPLHHKVLEERTDYQKVITVVSGENQTVGASELWLETQKGRVIYREDSVLRASLDFVVDCILADRLKDHVRACVDRHLGRPSVTLEEAWPHTPLTLLARFFTRLAPPAE